MVTVDRGNKPTWRGLILTSAGQRTVSNHVFLV
jgi:hypothetical protein